MNLSSQNISSYNNMEAKSQITDFIHLGRSDANIPRDINNIISIGEEYEYSSKLHGVMVHKFLNIEDSSSQNIIKYLSIITELIEKVRLDGQYVYIHCRYGMSRSPIFVIAYLIRYQKYTYIEAYTYVIQRRQISIAPSFVRQLEIWCESYGYKY